MANRAYLYSADHLEPWPKLQDPYYDSRWAVPFAWFFFYRPSDVYRVEVRFEGAHWQETKLAAERESAVSLFRSRKRLLLAAVGSHLKATAIEAFTKVIGAWQGRFLLMDPSEVFGGRSEDDSWHAEQFTTILGVLGAEGTGRPEVLGAVRPYVGWLDSDLELLKDSDLEQLLKDVIGYTYW